MSDYSKLKTLAQAATQGEWAHWKHGVIKGGPVVQFSNGSSQQQIVMTTGTEWMRPDEQGANADFIAAANPAAVLELIAELQRYEMLYRQSEKTLDRVHCMWAKRMLDATGERQTVLIPDEEFVKYFEELKQLKAENELLRTALTTIREESHDIGACECAADALVDSRRSEQGPETTESPSQQGSDCGGGRA